MSKTAKKKFKKEVVSPIVEEAKKLPVRPGRVYDANMDNVIFESFFVKGSDVDDKGKYVPCHLRETEKNVVLSVGPIVNNPKIKKGAAIVPDSISHITILEMDEFGYIGSIKPHNIIAITK